MDIQRSPGSIAPEYQAIAEAIVERWAFGKPKLQSSGKPSGYYRLTNYLLEYIKLKQALPTGIHNMPEGRDCFNNLEPSFPVDFDTIIGGIVVPD